MSAFRTVNSKALQEHRFTEYMPFWQGYTIKLLHFLDPQLLLMVVPCAECSCMNFLRFFNYEKLLGVVLHKGL